MNSQNKVGQDMIPVIIGDKDIIIEQVTAEDGEFQHYAIKFSPELTERLNRLNDLETHTSFADWKKKVVFHPPKSDVQRFAHKQVNYICEEAGNKLMRNCPKSDELDNGSPENPRSPDVGERRAGDPHQFSTG